MSRETFKHAVKLGGQNLNRPIVEDRHIGGAPRLAGVSVEDQESADDE